MPCVWAWLARELFMDGYDASTGKRIYDRVAGMTCHQCRQKTLGRHTSCSECQTLHVSACPTSPSVHACTTRPPPVKAPTRMPRIKCMCPLLHAHTASPLYPPEVDNARTPSLKSGTPIRGTDCQACVRSSGCWCAQGVFCGDCLFMRYGENILEVQASAQPWVCPPCRGLCNCSFHRIRNGWAPTGTLYRRALREGAQRHHLSFPW